MAKTVDVRKLEADKDVGRLIAALGSTDWGTSHDAADALGRIGEPVVEPLIATISDEDSGVRWHIAAVLGKIGDLRAVEPLIAALSDKDPNVRWDVAEALGRISDLRAVEPLIAALSDEDPNVRWHAAGALGRIGDPRAIEPLITAISDENPDVCWDAAGALGEIGDPAIELLIAVLSDEDPNVRWAAAEALGMIGDPRAIEPLIAALSDEDSGVRLGAAEALGEIGDPRAVPALEKAINDYVEEVRRRVGATLAEIKSSNAYKEYLKKPEITLKFPEETFKPNTWKRIEITIKNTGSMHAKKIKIKTSSDIEFRRIPTIPQIDANETKTMIIGMKPTVTGDVPLDIAITFKDAFDREYTASEEIWLLVAESRSMSESISINEFSPRQGQSEYKYQVALSFAGEDRKYAERLAGLLKNENISIFYDKYEQADLWGKDLYQHLQSVYRDKAQFCVVFLSKAYAQKLWTRHELESAQARAFREHREYILPIKIDDTGIPGINETIGYIDLKSTSLEEIADMLVKKLSSQNLKK